MGFWKKQPRPALYDQVYTVQNLADAWKKVRRAGISGLSKGWAAGVDGVSILDFDRNWTDNLAELALTLEQRRYQPQPVRHVQIPKKDKAEMRTIGVLAVQDRIAQRAVLNILEPVFEAQFLDCSYGFRPGRSVGDAITAIVNLRSQGHEWVVDADIQHFFDTINQGLLIEMVKSHIQDKEIMRLLEAWLAAGVLPTAADDDPPTGGLVALRDTTVAYLERAATWGTDRLLNRDSAAARYADDAGPLPTDAATARQEAVKRLAGDALLLGLSFSRPVLQGAKVLPSLGRQVVQRLGAPGLAVGATLAAGAVLVPLASRRLRQYRPAGPVGTPQGGVISPLLANVYLHPFDLAITQAGYSLVRFADDFVVLCKSPLEAQTAMAAVKAELARLQLALNRDKTRIVPYDEGFQFLGSVFGKEGVVQPLPDRALEKAGQFARSGYAKAREQAAKAVKKGAAVWKERRTDSR